MPFLTSEYSAVRTSEGTKLLSNVVFISDRTNERLTVPKGFVSNLASIPRYIRPWFSNDTFGIALSAILHDYLYTQDRRKHADRHLLEALRSEGIGSIKARMMYLGVRMGGRSHHKPI